MSSKYIIKNSDNIVIDSPSIDLKTNNLILGNAPPVSSSNINLLTWDNTNNTCGVVNSGSVPIQTDIQNIGGFSTLVNNPGINTVHNIKTITSSNSSIGITSNPSFLNMVSNVSLNNLGSGITVVSNPGTGPSFSLKSILQSTGINITDNVSDVLIELKRATPEEIGGVFGNQDKFSNHIGFENQIKLPTQSNIIGSLLPSGPSVNQSNILVSYPNFQFSTGVYESCNMVASGSGSELQNSQYSHFMVNNLDASSVNMSNCLYIGNMRNVRPDDNSVCINSDLYSSGIRMAQGSWYIGAGQNSLSLGNNEMHIDTRCPSLYYHDLGSGVGSSLLYYEPSSGLITYDNNIFNPGYGTLRFNAAASPTLSTSNQLFTAPGTYIAAGSNASFTLLPSYGLTYNGPILAPVEINYVGFIVGTSARNIIMTLIINGITTIPESVAQTSIGMSTIHPISLQGIRTLSPGDNISLVISSNIVGGTISLSGSLSCKIIR